MGCECTTPRRLRDSESPETLKQSKRSPSRISSVSEAAIPGLQMLSKPITSLYRFFEPKLVGRGVHVVRAEYIGTKQQCVLKMFSKPGPLLIQRARVKFAEDCSTLRKLDHPHIARIYEVLEDAKSFYIVTEAVTGGSVRDYIQGKAALTERLIGKIVGQILDTLQYCHRMGVAHKGLRMDNILLVESPRDDTLWIKLTDFDRSFSSEKHLISAPDCSLAPEIYSTRGDVKSDIWSCGVILHELLTGVPPLTASAYSAVLSLSKFWSLQFPRDVWSEVSSEARSLVGSMLSYTQNSRPSAWQCLSHPWFLHIPIHLPLDDRAIRFAVRNLMEVQGSTKLKEAIKRYFIYRVARDCEIQHLEEAYMAIDKDGGGISRAKLTAVISTLGMENDCNDSVARIIDMADRNANGTLSFSEYIVFACYEPKLLSQKHLLAAFKSLDREDRNKVEVASLKHIFYTSPNEEKERLWTELLRVLRRREDEDLDFQEFTQLMLRAAK